MAERIYIENLHHRVVAPSADPVVRELTDTFNDMIARLEKAVRRQTLFISDASHELRTPIAVIKGYADLINRWGKDDPKVLNESIAAIQAETEHMNTLLQSLLMLAKNDDSIMPEKSLVSLNTVAGEAIHDAVLINGSASVTLIEHSHESILANYDMILQLLRIFLDNCVKYALDPNDPIQIIIDGDGDGSYLTVKDFGVGISEEDLPYIFERFYRADKSHSSRVPGVGLGLAVADMIARAHGAAIGVYSEPGAGAEFTVSFPRGV